MSISNRSLPKGEEKKYVKLAIQAGWDIRRLGSKHWALISPEGKRVVCSSTPKRGGRGSRNFRADLRRNGLKIR